MSKAEPSNYCQNRADEKYSGASESIKKRAADILKEELNIINRSVKKPLSEIQINTVAGTFEMDDDPPSQIYDEYLEGTSIKPIQFYARCCKSIDEAVKEEKMERSEKKKKSTAKGRRKTNKKKTNKKKTNKKKTNKKKTNKKKQFTPLKI